jgi:hypothetical protein
LGISEEIIFAAARGKSLGDSESFDSEIAVLFSGYESLSEKDKAELLSSVRLVAAEIQRRRPAPAPPAGKARPSKKGAAKK